MSISIVINEQGVISMEEKKRINWIPSVNDLNYPTESEKKLPYILTIIIQLIVLIWVIRMTIAGDVDFDSNWDLWVMFAFCLPGAVLGVLILTLSILYIYYCRYDHYILCTFTVFYALLIGGIVIVTTRMVT
jgi:hypothetical protein